MRGDPKNPSGGLRRRASLLVRGRTRGAAGPVPPRRRLLGRPSFAGRELRLDEYLALVAKKQVHLATIWPWTSASSATTTWGEHWLDFSGGHESTRGSPGLSTRRSSHQDRSAGVEASHRACERDPSGADRARRPRSDLPARSWRRPREPSDKRAPGGATAAWLPSRSATLPAPTRRSRSSPRSVTTSPIRDDSRRWAPSCRGGFCSTAPPGAGKTRLARALAGEASVDLGLGSGDPCTRRGEGEGDPRGQRRRAEPDGRSARRGGEPGGQGARGMARLRRRLRRPETLPS